MEKNVNLFAIYVNLMLKIEFKLFSIGSQINDLINNNLFKL
jgi:hypothetical protein